MSTPQRRERLRHLVELLRSSRTLTSTQLAKALNVSRRTIFRDIQELQSRGINVVWSEVQQAYHLEITSEVPDLGDESEQFLGTRPMQTVRIWFDERVAEAVANLRWVSSKKLNGDGSIVADVRVSRFDDIIHWILGYGERAKVLEPPELCEQILDWLTMMRKVYEDDSAP